MPKAPRMLFILGAFCLLGYPLFSQNRDQTKKQRQSQEQNVIFHSALEFLIYEGSSEKIQKWFDRFLENKIQDHNTINLYVSYLLKSRNRQAINGSFLKLSQAYSCLDSQKKHQFCEALKPLWAGHFDSYLFFEDSVSKIQKVKKFLKSGECQLAQSLAEELFQKEGPIVPVFELRLGAQSCLGAGVDLSLKREELDRMRLF
jgi:hypothetical protein